MFSTPLDDYPNIKGQGKVWQLSGWRVKAGDDDIYRENAII